ncbi:hypothetical protein C2E23DRAFT_763747 [Lenzites betulinus]|nr:hypothetical protein C2E23DRAFT_763747 [Lenzites betulinus]
MRSFAYVAAFLALCARSVSAQTTTVVDALGETVVELITLDLQGLPSTQTLQTLTTTTTAADGQQGPVGQPAATATDAGPTIYTYTTTDAAGDTVAVVDTFTPTFAATSPLSSIPAGTVIPYSSWLSLVGTNTVAAEVNSAVPRWALQHQWLGIATSLCAGVAGGAWLAFA